MWESFEPHFINNDIINNINVYRMEVRRIKPLSQAEMYT